MHFLWITVLTALLSAVFSWAIIKLAKRYNLLHHPRERDVHTTATPRLGGVAMFLALMIVGTLVYFAPGFNVVREEPIRVLGVALGVLLIVILGVIDDLYDLDWMLKLGVQLLAAGIIAWFGAQNLSLPLGDTLIVGSPIVNFGLTIFLLVLVMNAVNFIDGLDGLVAGVAIIGNVVFFIYTRIIEFIGGVTFSVTFASVIAALVLGACLGFLPFNWRGAKMFMGDAGALMIGLLMATSAVSVTGQLNPAVLDQKLVLSAYIPIIMPVGILIMPLADFALAVVRRVSQGKSPFAADRKHLHHRLLDYGHSHFQAAIVFYLWTAIISVTCLLVFVLGDYVIPTVILIFGIGICAVVTLVPFNRVRQVFRRKGKVLVNDGE